MSSEKSDSQSAEGGKCSREGGRGHDQMQTRV